MNQRLKQGIGALLGCGAAILILTIGFFKTLLIVLLALAGWWLAGDRTISKGSFRTFVHIGDEQEDDKNGSDEGFIA